MKDDARTNLYHLMLLSAGTFWGSVFSKGPVSKAIVMVVAAVALVASLVGLWRIDERDFSTRQGIPRD